MPLVNPHSTKTEFVHRMTAGHRQVLETTILAPAIERDVKEARVIHYGLWLHTTPQIRLTWKRGERMALEWLAEKLESWHWRDHAYPETDLGGHELRTFQKKAGRLGSDIRFELSDARRDTLADPQEVA
jgi:hypothetical protein